MYSAIFTLLQLCVNGTYICERSYTKPGPVYYEPEKSCYIDGVFYPRCKDFENPEVQHYHNLLKNK
jgi:hypothetical protein